MAKHKFSNAERYAVFVTHGRKCYLCHMPLDLISMVVDHVVPERLLDSPELLARAKESLGLPPSFEVNSFENWMPACASCNVTKGSRQFDPIPIIHIELKSLAEKASKARQLYEEAISDRRVAVALNTLERALESGHKFDATRRKRLSPLFTFALNRGLVPKEEPFRVTQTFRLVATSVEEAKHWGATHWSMPPRESHEPSLVVLFRSESGSCVECGLNDEVFQPIRQEGGGDPICRGCLVKLDWMPPILLGDLPTHVADG